jgi:hypothetical protein
MAARAVGQRRAGRADVINRRRGSSMASSAPPRRLSCGRPARYYIPLCNTLNLTRARRPISLSSPKSVSCPTRSTLWPLFKESYRVALSRGHRLASLAAIGAASARRRELARPSPLRVDDAVTRSLMLRPVCISSSGISARARSISASSPQAVSVSSWFAQRHGVGRTAVRRRRVFRTPVETVRADRPRRAG